MERYMVRPDVLTVMGPNGPNPTLAVTAGGIVKRLEGENDTVNRRTGTIPLSAGGRP